MSKAVNLNELIGEMEISFDEMTTYYHPESGNFYSISNAAFAAAEDDKASRMLQIAINGSGAFRRFKEMVYEFGLSQDWYVFRDEDGHKKVWLLTY